MPPVVAAIGAVVTSISAAITAVPLLGAVLSMGANMLLAKLMAPDVKTKGIKDKLESGGDNPLSFIMGKYATAGKLVYTNEYDGGDNVNNKLVMVVSLSEMPVSGLSSYVEINGEHCEIDFAHATSSSSFGDPNFDPDSPGPGFYRIEDYDKRDDDDFKRQYCWVKFHNGDQTTDDPYLTDTFGGDPDKPWTDDMIGRGCAYLIVVCRYSKKGVWSGIPQFKWVVEGVLLYNPRKDSTNGGSGTHRWNDRSTWEFSDNPVVMKYNIIRGMRYSGDWIWGGQDVSEYQLPMAYWSPAIAHCEENVTLAAGGTIDRYTAGCEIHVDQQPIDVIKELDKTCTGYTTEYGGTWKTFVGPPGSSVFSFTDDDIIITEDQTDNLFRPVQETYNGARATYVSQNAGWVMKEAAPRIFDDLQDEDGGLQLIADMQLPYVTNFNQAQRLMRAAVLDSRKQITHIMQMPPEAYILEPFDVVNWNSTRNGYVNKKFMVTSIEDLPNCNQLVALREINPNDYDWDVEFELPESVGPLKPVRPSQLALDFTVAADQIDSPSGKDRPAIAIDWDWNAPDIDVAFVKYEVRRDGTTKVIAHGTFHNTNDTTRTITSSALRFGRTYEVRLFAQPERAYRPSTWTGWKNVTCVIVDVPTAPTLTRVSDLADDGTLDFFVDVDWTAVTADVDYVVRVVSGGNTKRYKAAGNSLRIPATSGKPYTIDVAARANDGTVGDYSTSASITVSKKNTAPTTPAGLTAVDGNRITTLKWTKSPDADFKRTIIYASTTNNFTTPGAQEVGRTAGTRFVHSGLANSETWYYWITHEDRSGNESAKYPTSNTAGVTASSVAIAAAGLDQRPPNIPANPTLVSYTGDVDNDDTIDTGLTITITAPGVDSTHQEATSYSVQLWRCATIGGTYVYHKTYKTDDLSFDVEVPQKYFYKARIKATSFNGISATYSTLTAGSTGVQPLQYLGSIPTPTSFTAVAVGNGARLDWAQATFASYKDTVITATYSGGGPDTFTTKSNHFNDTKSRAVGLVVTYQIQHRDTQNRVGTNATGIAVTYRQVNTAELAPAAVTTAKIAPQAVTSVEVAPLAILPSKRFPQDPTNYVNDCELLELGNFSISGGGAALTQIINNTKGGSKYMLVGTGTTAGTITIATAVDIPVEDTETYWVRCLMGQQITPVSPAYPAGVEFGFGIYADFYDTDASGNPNTLLASVTIKAPHWGDVPNVFGYFLTEGVAVPPAGSQVARLRFTGLKRASLVDQISTLYISSPAMRRRPRNNEYGEGSIVGFQDIADLTVLGFQIGHEHVNKRWASFTAGNQTCGAGVDKLLESVPVTHLSGLDPDSIEFLIELHNVSGSAKTMDIFLYEGTNISGTLLKSWPNLLMSDNNYQPLVHTLDFPNPSATYRLYANFVSGGTVNRTWLQCFARNR
jgi:hypothetical protein